jgi:transcriptional regulator with XRE-family HTH domain
MFYYLRVDSRPRIRCGALLREARLRHGIDQAELARRAGTGQPAISRIERDVVSPTLETLNRLLEAMGETLTVQTLDLDAPAPGGSNQSIAELRADYRDLTPEERLAQAAHLSEIGTELAAGAER